MTWRTIAAFIIGSIGWTLVWSQVPEGWGPSTWIVLCGNALIGLSAILFLPDRPKRSSN